MDRKILVGDDHPIIRQGLITLFEHYFDVSDITEASSCSDIMKELAKTRYTHIILDVVLADGSILEVLPNIVNLYPKTRILIFSMQPAEIYRRVLNKYGVDYYLSKTALQDETLAQFGRFLNNEIVSSESRRLEGPKNPFSHLSGRELEVLHYVLKGTRTKEISRVLSLSENTISTIKKRIFEKTGVDNVRDLFELALTYNVA